MMCILTLEKAFGPWKRERLALDAVFHNTGTAMNRVLFGVWGS
jgi:hypothetical protein